MMFRLYFRIPPDIQWQDFNSALELNPFELMAAMSQLLTRWPAIEFSIVRER